MEEDFSIYNGPNTNLRIAQLRMLDILSVVHRICEENKIEYWIDYGTLLGAVRHGGFIPWDDDLDISILKKDFEKFSMLMQSKLPGNLVYQDWKNEKKLTLKVSKIREKNSYYDDGIYVKGDLKHSGIFIDVFPVEYVPSKSYKFFVDYFYGRAFRRIRGKNVSLFEKIISYLMMPLAYVLVLSSRIITKLVQSKLLMNTYGGLNFKCAHQKDIIFPLRKINFEGSDFYAPNNIDIHLKEIYGNYMQIPAKDKRQTHAVKIEIFN